ncbi:MAG: glycosyltransferase family 4 protein [Saprospiraceae bacterium]
MKSILFLSLHRPNRSPSQRFRFEQYILVLEADGWQCQHSYLIGESDDRFFYKEGFYLKKLMVVIRSIVLRLTQSVFTNRYDVVFIQRESFMLGTTIFERMFSKNSKLIFDFDDAIWMHQKGEIRSGNKALSFLKRPSKTAELISISDMVFAGNSYLAKYALQFSNNVKIVPTTIDTEEYSPRKKELNSNRICIGWSGSFTTIPHFKHAIPALKVIKKKYGSKVYFKVIGDDTFRNDKLGIQGIAWKKETEITELQEIDIGLMPLPDEEWTKGKCGLKGLQYMALEIPTIMSPVGVNVDIVNHGENAFLANTKEEWVESMSILIDNSQLRRTIGKSGRNTVVKNYSVKANAPLYLKYFNELMASS